mmetsp:Transcript_87951/g.210158  ORF Transcript_87951/g.210158 Transcript_87951/m.210158 type:complete len:230 (-) Transcript_87951:1688-2377(-)
MHLGLEPLVERCTGIVCTSIEAQTLANERLLNLLGSTIRGKDDQRVLEGHHTALGIGQMAVLEDLQHQVKDVRVRLLNFIKENQAVRFPSNCVCQLALFIVPNVSGRTPDQLRHSMLLHELAHIQAHHGVFHTEIRFGQGLAKLRLPDAGWATEDKGCDWPLGILQPCTCTAHSLGDSYDSLLLANHTLVQRILQVNQSHGLIGSYLLHRNLCPGRYHSRHVILGNRGL